MRYFYLTALIFTATIAFGQNRQEKALGKQLDRLINEQYPAIAPGCAVLVARNGQIVYQKAFGTANLELNVAMQPEMIFRIGSITKQFTAIAMLQLVEKGKISLNDSIQKFIKDYPPKGQLITIENLLTQTSGIPDYLNFEFDLPNPFRVDIPAKQIIDSIKVQPLQFTPSSKFEYSNSNYFLLGYIIEQVSGLSYPDYLVKNIFTPAGLTNTSYETASDIVSNRVSGYEKSGNNYKNADFITMAAFYSAGGLISNTTDLLKWNNALNDGKIIGRQLLDKAYERFRLSNGELSEYGYGWFIRDLEGSRTIEHGGSIFGFRSQEIFLPDSKIYVAGLFNCRQLNNDQQALCYDIATLALGKSITAGVNLSNETLDKYVGTYRLSTDSNRTVKVNKHDNQLIAQLQGSESLPLIFSSQTRFQFKNLRNAVGEFIIENGKVTSFTVIQDGHFEWIKVR